MNKTLFPKIAIIIGVFIIMGAAGYWYWHDRTIHPSTDDAYIQANIINIAAQVTGPISAIYVQDHQAVKKGQTLFDILPTNYEAALAQAEAQTQQAEKTASRLAALSKLGYVSQSDNDAAQTALGVAQATFNQAKLNVGFTHVTAPADGTLVNFTLRVGSAVTPGMVLFSIVEDNVWWVDANYKETQLARIKPGQSATVSLDMYPGYAVKGTVQEISSGSGAAFSLLPPENATGNWIKVTQRFPVKIMLTNPDSEHPLRVGASATVTIDTRT